MSYPRPPPGAPMNEAILQVDQQITHCLQRIDAKFALAHEIIQGGILPKIRRYGEHSLQIGDSAKFWRMFFETSAQVRLTQVDDELYGQEADGNQSLDESEQASASFDPLADISGLDQPEHRHDGFATEPGHHSFDESLLGSTSGERMPTPPRPSLGALKEDGHDHRTLQPEPVRDNDQSDMSLLADVTPPTSSMHPVPNMESPFSKVKRAWDAKQASGEEEKSFDRPGLGHSFPLVASHLSTPRAKPRHEGADEQEDRIATPPKASSETLDPSLNKRRMSLAAAAAANMTRNRFGAKVVATPLAGAPEGTQPINPFANVAESPSTPRPLAEVQSLAPRTAFRSSNAPESKPASWNGIADLRAAPVRAAGHTPAPVSPVRAGSRSGSPPVTMQFSIPRSKWLKTPAKEAARQVVDDLLRTAERYGPSADELISRRHAEYALAKESPSRPPAPLFQEETETGGANSDHDAFILPSHPESARRNSSPSPPRVTPFPSLASHANLLSSQRSQDSTDTAGTSKVVSERLDKPTSAQRLTDDEISSSSTGAQGPLARFAAQTFGPAPTVPSRSADDPQPADDSDSDSDDDTDDSDDSDGAGHASPPVATGPAGLANAPNPTPSSASLLSSRSGLSSDLSAVQALKDDTLFGSKLGANPFLFGGSGSNASNSNSGSTNGSITRPPAVSSFAPRGNVGDLGTFNMGRPLVGEDQDFSSPLKGWRGKDRALGD